MPLMNENHVEILNEVYQINGERNVDPRTQPIELLFFLFFHIIISVIQPSLEVLFPKPFVLQMNSFVSRYLRNLFISS